jgi:hypothetical protein
MTQAEPTLPSNRAFVVKFRAGRKLVHSHPGGRSKYMVPGQTAFFVLGKQLRKFVEHLFTSFRDRPPW